MKKLTITIAFTLITSAVFSQGQFDSFENEDDVTSVVVTKNMFKLLGKMDLNSQDPDAKQYLEMVDNLDNVKVFTTENPLVGRKMDAAVAKHIASSSGLSELMRVKDDGKNIKFYSREGKNENFVSELLMHLNGTVDGKKMTVIMSITGDIDLRQISKLAVQLNVPGSEELKNMNTNKKNK